MSPSSTVTKKLIDQIIPTSIMTSFVAKKTGNVYWTEDDPPFMQEWNPVTERKVKPWADLTYKQKQRRTDQFDEARVSKLKKFRHVTYQVPPHRNQAATAAAASASNASSPVEDAVNRQIAQLLAVSVGRLNLQEEAAKKVDERVTVTEANSLKLTETLSVLNERVNSDAETAAANTLATNKALTTHTETLTTHTKLIKTNTEIIKLAQEDVIAHRKDIKALKDKYERIEKQVEGVIGEVAIKTTALTNTTEIHHGRLVDLCGAVEGLIRYAKTPGGELKKKRAMDLTIDTGNWNLSTPETSPVGLPGSNVFTFGVDGTVSSPQAASPADAKPPVVMQRSPTLLTNVVSFGQEPRFPYEFERPIKTCFEYYHKLKPFIFMLGCDLAIQIENAPFAGNSDFRPTEADEFLPTAVVVFTTGVAPTTYVCLECLQDGIPLKEIKHFNEVGLEWEERELDGRNVNVLVNSGAPIDEATKQKLTLLMGRPDIVGKGKAPVTDQGTVLYRRALRDENDEVQTDPESGEILYATTVPEELHIDVSTEDTIEGDLEAYIHEGVLDEADKDTVGIMAEVGIELVVVLPQTSRLDLTRLDSNAFV